MLTSKDKERLRARRYLQRKRRRARDDGVEAAALLLTQGERCIALYRIFADPIPFPHNRRNEQQQTVKRLTGLAGARVIDSRDQPESLSAGHRYAERNSLASTIEACQAQNATLIIAVLGHLAASATVLSQLAASGIKFVACDNPTVNHTTVWQLAAAAQRTKTVRIERLRATQKANGRVFSMAPGISAIGVAANRADAALFAAQIVPIVQTERRDGCTEKKIAEKLNACGYRTRRGRAWTRESLHRFLRLHANTPLPKVPQPILPLVEVAVDRGMPAASGASASESAGVSAEKWMAAYAADRSNEGRKVNRDAAVAECMTETGCSWRQARQAYKTLPSNYKFRRGRPWPSSLRAPGAT
jgi:hypothetical protein